VAVLDVRMPIMNGLEVQAYLSENSPETRIIFVSGQDDPVVRQTALDAGAFGFLAKPFEDEVLVQLIHKAVAHYVVMVGHPSKMQPARGWKVFEAPGVEPVFPGESDRRAAIVHRLATAPMRRSHSSRLPRKPSSQAVLKLSRAIISRRFPLFVSLTFR
jgi:DNA-binding NarL/FixJ family response regulator